MPAVAVKLDDKTTKNIAIVLIVIVVIIILAVVFFKFSKSIADRIEDKEAADAVKENESSNQEIADRSGVSKSRVSACRSIASGVAKALLTHKDTPFYYFNEDEDLAIELLNQARNEDEMILIAELYRTDMTSFNNLKADLRSKLFTAGLNKIDLLYVL